MRCGWAVKGEGKKPKFGECVRARGRGESFTCSVHARRAKAGAFLDLAGEKRAKVGRCFRFPSSFFELQSSGALAAVDRWEESACEMGMGLRFGPWDAGAASTAWRGENTARNAVVKRCALSRCSSFVFYAFSRLRRESPRVLLLVMIICEICRRFPFLIACKRREYSMNCDFLIWCFPEKILILPSEKPHPVCGSLFHFLVLRRPSYFPLTPRSVSTVTARVRAD